LLLNLHFFGQFLESPKLVAINVNLCGIIIPWEITICGISDLCGGKVVSVLIVDLYDECCFSYPICHFQHSLRLHMHNLTIVDRYIADEKLCILILWIECMQKLVLSETVILM